MDPLDFLAQEELALFFRRQKTEMSLMKNPQTFLRQLRDYDLIPDELFESVTRMRTKESLQKGLYTALDWFERNKPKRIPNFWECAFQESIRNQYPTLRRLRTSLMDGSFFNSHLSEEVEEDSKKKVKKQKKERRSQREDDVEEEEEQVSSEKRTPRKRRSNMIGSDDEEEEEEEQVSSEKRTPRKRKSNMIDDDDDDNEEEEQPGPSSQATPGQRKKSSKMGLYSPLRKGQQKDIWTWPMYKTQLPVICGSQEGTLSRRRLAKAEKCIRSNNKLYSPAEFERRGGKAQCKNWKTSIKCMGTPLAKLIQEGHLEAGTFKKKPKETGRAPPPRATPPCDEETSDENTETEELGQRLPQGDGVFEVTCGGVAATLHQQRFATGTLGKCVRTDAEWLSPKEFVEKVTGGSQGQWKRDILHQGRPLAHLVQDDVLRIHSLRCDCSLCAADEISLAEQRNDDECCVCKRDTTLVLCDYCPLSFHQTCHLPHINDSTIRGKTKWMCTFCITNQPMAKCREQEMEVALSQPIERHLAICQCLILYLYCADDKHTFNHSENDAESPRWLQEATVKLQSRKYETLKDFKEDVTLIINRCASNSPASHEFPALELFQDKFKKLFNIIDQRVD